jgi:protein SCO1/2
MSRTVKALLGLWIVVLVGALGWIGWDAYQPSTPAGQGSDRPIGGPFSLADQDGRTFTDADLKGKPTLLYFGYTFCPDVCPTSLLLMENAAEQLGADGPRKVNLVFITIDPERDTQKLMKGYVTNFGSTFEGLTGTPEQIASVAHAYDVYYEKVAGKDGAPYLMAHSSIIYLLDRQGGFIGHFPHDSTPEEIAKALKELM